MAFLPTKAGILRSLKKAIGFYCHYHMQVHFFKPANQLLTPYLEGYYFLSRDAGEPATSYLTFPNNFAILSICEQVSIQYDKSSLTVKGEESGITVSELICHFKTPVTVTYQGIINEITFYFKPLGLNAFLPQPLSAYTSDFFSAFEPYDDYIPAMKAILNEPEHRQRCALVENYWLSKFSGFEHPFLHSLVQDLLQKNVETLEQLAHRYTTTRQNIYKQFELHLCKSPVAFRKIQRFREALIRSIKMKQKGQNLTALSYDTSFYDQSHLIKDFKSLTGLTPKKFLDTISFQEEATVNWLYL